jgi:hypothetical protein
MLNFLLDQVLSQIEQLMSHLWKKASIFCLWHFKIRASQSLFSPNGKSRTTHTTTTTTTHPTKVEEAASLLLFVPPLKSDIQP